MRPEKPAPSGLGSRNGRWHRLFRWRRGTFRHRRDCRRSCSGGSLYKRRGFPFAPDPGKRSAYWHLGFRRDQDLFNLAGVIDLYFDRPLLRLDNGDDVAAFHLVARLDQPLNEGARFHVSTERGHTELGHGAPLRSSKRGFRGGNDLRHLRDRRDLKVPGVWDRDFFAAHPANRSIEVPERLLNDACANFRGEAAAAPPFIYDYGPARFLHGRHDGPVIERAQGPQVDYLRVDVFFG